jgi:hypothetical protein
MDTVEAIRLIALRDVIKGGTEYSLRYLYRWYSKTFATPLAEVYDLDLHDLLQAFFEEKFEGMEPDALEETREELLLTEAQRAEEAAKMTADARAEAELLEMSRQETQGLEKLTAAAPVTLEELGPLPENTKLEFIPDDEFEALTSGGFATQTRKTEPII